MSLSRSQSRAGFLFICIFMLIAFSVFTSKKAEACCNCTMDTAQPDALEWFAFPFSTVPRVNNHVTSEFTGLRSFIVSTMWEDNILPAMQLMTDELSAAAMYQAQIIGSLLDAKTQLETQQSLQKMATRAHKDYQPSTGMCQFGSSTKSLAASERKAEFNAVVLSQRSQDRGLGNRGTAAAIGNDGDKFARIKQFREKFCDPQDNNNGLGFLCDHDQNFSGGAVGAANDVRKNKDIDFARTVDSPWTLNIDFTDATLTDEEEEVMALASNLYGHEVFLRPNSLKADPGQAITNMQSYYLDARSVLAKRGVAENSFNAITAMKSAGTPGSKDYLKAVLTELGVSDTGADSEALKLLGQNPSYYAQMEVLTKKIYQSPDFYTNLYDKPANVDRKNVALQAIGLMQKFDLFKSYLRNEASLAVLLELSVIKLQSEAENEINPGNNLSPTRAQ
jgi:hypothetical protein